MSAAFTPGPWSLAGPPYDSVPWMHIYGPTDERGIDHHVMHRDRSEEEKLANAHLIAAAPELYEALVDAMSAMRPLAHYYEINDQRDGNLEVPVRELGAVLRATKVAIAALAKARGESA